MSTIDILIIAIILFVLLLLYKKSRDKSNDEQFQGYDASGIIGDVYDVNKQKGYDTDPSKYIDDIIAAKNRPKVNENFLEMQFHQDYRDTFNAFELIVPNVKELFNKSDLPIINITKPPQSEIKKLVTKFIREVNSVVKNHVNDNLSPDDWGNNLPEKDFTAGWEKHMSELGLPTSIYNKPAGRQPIRLIKIDHAEKYETNDEIRYFIFLIVQKKNVKDQMVLKVSFFLTKTDLNLDREFFDKDKNAYETAIAIENISIIGFLVNHSYGKQSNREKLYNFGNLLDRNNGGGGHAIINQKEIIKVLNKKRKNLRKTY